MPLPLILGVAAAVAGVAGAGAGIHGAVKMKDANDTMKSAKARHEANTAKFEKENKETLEHMDALGNYELDILSSFEKFSDLIERIQNRPEFKAYQKDGVKLPKYEAEEIKKVSVGAGVLLGGMGGAALGTAGGFAAAGVTTAAVMALGTASTGTAIASLSGAALTNATLAALGGGAIAAGGGGIALGTTILGAATLGVGLLVGGVIFGITGSSLSNKADEAWLQMKKAEEQINKICAYLTDLRQTSDSYLRTIKKVDGVYRQHLNWMDYIITVQKKTNWFDFTEEEQTVTENTVLLVQLLYTMCKVKLVIASEKEDAINEINTAEIAEAKDTAKSFLQEKGYDVSDLTEEQDKTAFDVVLVDVGSNKMAVIKLIKAFTSLDLAEIRDIVTNIADTNTPYTLKKQICKTDAEDLKACFEEMGAKVELK